MYDYDDDYGTRLPLGSIGSMSVDVTTMTDKNATVSTVTMYAANEVIQVTGSSKRERGDVYDRELGEIAATRRAVTKLAAELQKRERKLIKKLPENVLVQKETEAAEAAAKRIATVLAAAQSVPSVMRPSVYGYGDLYLQ